MRILSQINQPYNPYALNFSANETIAVQNDSATNSVNKNKHKNIESAVTIATFASVGGAFMLSRGVQKNTGKYLNKIKDYLKGKRQQSYVKESNNWTSFYEHGIQRINAFIKKSESINNITSLKDILIMRLMYKTKPTKKIHQSITNYFEKISKRTYLKSYKQTEKDLNRMNKIFDNLDEYILQNSPDEIIEYKGKKYTKKELIDKARNHRDIATTIVTNFIEKSTIDYRYNMIQDITSTLYSRFWDASFKDFWSKNNKFKNKEMWQSFIAAEQIKGDKTKLATGIATIRNALTYTGYDRNNIMHEYIDKLDGIISPDDFAGYEIIEKLKWFARNSEGLKNNKELFLEELSKLKKYKIKTTDKNLAKTQEECKATYIDTVSSLIGDNSTGEIQDMLSIYYKIAPFKMEKFGAEIALKKLVKSFDKSVNLECVEFFDKVRDLKLGSAPTDILTILFSFIALSAGLGYANDKDKRISIMFKSGIPLIGGIATTILTASRLVSGGKSLALGFLSAIILNQFGKIADNMRENDKYINS